MPFHSYIFFDKHESLRSVPREKLTQAKRQFADCISKAKSVRSHAYATLGFKTDTFFVLHLNAKSPDAIQVLLKDLMHTDLGQHLQITYTLFGMTRPSPYNRDRQAEEVEWEAEHRYLVVYPFTKTVEWHLKPHDVRHAIMKDHVGVGRKHSDKISQRLLYSYGVDDHEFVVSYQMDDLAAFQTLVMDMRTTESRRYTKNDLPIFTCIHMSLKEAVDMV